jgi:hypothetical protein
MYTHFFHLFFIIFKDLCSKYYNCNSKPDKKEEVCGPDGKLYPSKCHVVLADCLGKLGPKTFAPCNKNSKPVVRAKHADIQWTQGFDDASGLNYNYAANCGAERISALRLLGTSRTTSVKDCIKKCTNDALNGSGRCAVFEYNNGVCSMFKDSQGFRTASDQAHFKLVNNVYCGWVSPL